MPLSPELYSPDARTRLLVVAPHPDDETIGTGELLQLVRAAGGQVRVLLLTDGDDNPWPQRWLERRLRIGDAERASWGRRRREEVTEALRRLELPPGTLHAMGWPDMGLTALVRGDASMARARLVEQLADFRPNVVALPALSDRHPDHGSAHVLMRLALADWDAEPPLLLGYLVHGRGEMLPAVALPAAAERHAAKLAALTAHGSQMALSAGRMRRLTSRPECYDRVARPPAGREAGALPWRPGAWRSQLRLTIASPDGVLHWSWAEAPLQRDGQRRWRLADVPTAPCFARLDMDVPSPWIFDRWGWCEL
ncbi:MAG TPA: PIG-L family deacetylase [Frateuria sp.]|uniref:PIG-L deacetylase family protein n=1 Tax=Frateuria sp. TaxID=2211372 RepID=UPI002D800CFA|nr:PIG-L family deacetylase [Frateuria sp.]HET6805907.1 PIG-L family deacetylase [Frateuria sp.]